MRNHFFTRFLVIALILVFSCSLSVPAFAVEDLDYQYSFTHEFAFSDFTLVSGWYTVSLGDSFDPVAASGDYVKFTLDDYEYRSSFKSADVAGLTHHYIGNAFYMLGVGEDTGDSYCLVICPDEPTYNMLCLKADFFSPLFQGDKTKIHVAMSVAHYAFESEPFLDKFFSLFSDIGQWLRAQIDLIIGLFWNAKAVQLTFFGVLSLVSLGLSVVLLLIKVILNFLHLRG